MNKPNNKLVGTSTYYQLLKMAAIASLFLISCTPKPNQLLNASNDVPVPFVLKYDRGPCFGKCPVYTFYLLADHTALVNSKANLTDTSGWYHASPDQEGIVEILELLEPAEWWTPQLNNEPEIADLPHVSLTYLHPESVRTISIQSNTTPALENVFEKINHIVSNSMWKPTTIRPMQLTASEPTNVIVQLKPGIDINEWMRRYENFGIQLVKRVSPNQQYYVVSKDPLRGASNDFLQYIKIDPDVVDAQWDKELQRRN